MRQVTDIAPVQARIRALHDGGVTYRVIADLAGVNPNTITALMSPTRETVSVDIAERVLALDAVKAALPAGRVPATVTLAGVDRLVAAGMRRCELAALVHGPNSRHLQIKVDAATVLERHADVIAGLVERLEAGTLTVTRRLNGVMRLVTLAVNLEAEAAITRTAAPAVSVSVPLRLSKLVGDRPWLVDAECRNHASDYWFSDEDADIERAKKVCATCPVMEECREWGLAHREVGVLGGLSERERRRIQRRSREAVAA